MKSPSLLSKCEVNCVTTYSLFEVVSQAELCYYSTNDASNDKSYGKSQSWPQWIRHFKSLFHLNINLQASGVSHPISHHVQFLWTQLYPLRFNNQLYTELLIDMLQPLSPKWSDSSIILCACHSNSRFMQCTQHSVVAAVSHAMKIKYMLCQ